ncbi:hypothetical protein Q3V20_02740, partial [Mesomycoplasma ovipneumoniae]|uniref:hypothetical protein n=1 Tax=Mesomycoplasma ovipneumoniae TaxID=29562 RepID=UPI0026DD9271
FFFFLQRVDFKTIKIKVLLSKKLGFTGIFAYLDSIKSEFFYQTAKLRVWFLLWYLNKSLIKL